MSIEGDIAHMLLRSPRTELYELVDFYFGDHLEMACNSAVTLEKIPFMVILYVYKNMELCNTVILRRQSLNHRLLDGFPRKELLDLVEFIIRRWS